MLMVKDDQSGLAWRTLVAGAGISISYTDDKVTIASTGGGGTSTDTIVTWALARNVMTTVGTNKANELIMPRVGTPVVCYAICKTAPIGLDMIFDIKYDGVSIWANNLGNRLRILSNTLEAETTVFDPAAVIPIGAVLTIDVVQVGTAVSGGDITIELITV
jgi:hypothetical protein